jgi:hypothetical protein
MTGAPVLFSVVSQFEIAIDESGIGSFTNPTEDKFRRHE